MSGFSLFGVGKTDDGEYLGDNHRMKSKTGLMIRLAILGVAVANGISFGTAPEVEQMKQEVPNELNFAASIIAIFYMAGFVYFALNWNWKRDKNKDWTRPNWFSNSFDNPLQFFHLLAFFFIGFGLPALIIRLINGKGPFFETFVLCSGIGVFLGVKQFIKRHKIA